LVGWCFVFTLVRKDIPLKEGLRPFAAALNINKPLKVRKDIPLKEGLRRLMWLFITSIFVSPKGYSTKRRIKTSLQII